MGAPPAPFVRFSRDRRGYESVYLVHIFGRPPRPRILYWFRSPPGVKLGRLPFDDNVRKSLEAQYPDVRFDWKRITETQPPPVSEGEVWRERRRAERSAKQARQAAKRERAEPDVTDEVGDETPPSGETGLAAQPEGEGDVTHAADVTTEDGPFLDSAESPLAEDEPEGDAGGTGAQVAVDAVGQGIPQGEGGVVSRGRRRRRRRGGRNRNRPAGSEGPGLQATGPERPEPEPQGPDPEIRTGEPSSGEEPSS